MATKCLDCGEEALQGSRAAASGVYDLLKRLLTRCLESCVELDLDSLIGSSYVCRGCSRAYDTHQKKEARLYSSTANFLFIIPNMPVPSGSLGRRRVTGDSLQSSVKRSCSILADKPDYGDKATAESPPIMVGIGHRSGSKSYTQTTPRRKNFVKKIARCVDSAKSIASAALKDDEVLRYLSIGIGKLMKKEITMLCSKAVNSIQKSHNRNDIISFPWARVLQEAKEHCPVFISFLLAITETKTLRPHRVQFMCAVICMISKYHYGQMSLFQRLISTILYSGHSGTAVYNRLHKFSICMSKRSLYSLITNLGSDHDLCLKNWQSTLLGHTHSQPDLYSMENATEVCDANNELEIDADAADETPAINEAADANKYVYDADISEFVNTSEVVTVDEDGPGDNVDLEETVSTCCSTPNPPDFSVISLNSDHSLDVVEPDEELNETLWKGFKIVGDNIDLNVLPRNRRIDKQTQSLHFFQCYTVRDRIDLSQSSEEPNPFIYKPVSELPIGDLLPSLSDDRAILKNFSILIGRVLVQQLPYFSKAFEGVTTNHIKHMHYDKMSEKSETVPLGVILKNENVLEDMIDILMQLSEYVPCEHQSVVDSITQLEVPHDLIHPVLFGGDQLTRKRMESAKEGRKNDITLTTKLKGLTPVCEDWHTKKTFLEMTWKSLYNTKSFLDVGTLCQLRNVIDRRNISATAPDDFNACDDFFVTVVQCHIVAAAMEHLGMKKQSDLPVHDLLKCDLWLENEETRRHALEEVTKEISLSYIDILAHNDLTLDIELDQVKRYAVEVLSQGLLYIEFSDAIREGDGDRILRCWRYLMLVFKAKRRTNYSIEALNILAQHHFFLSQRQASQLIWSRCINTRGIPGHNIPCDLYMEHLNRICKNAVRLLGSNKTPNAFVRVGKCVGVLDAMLEEFDKDLLIREASGKHSTPNSDKDKNLIMQQLLNAQVFSYVEGRKHSCFEEVAINIVSSKKHCNKLKEWMIQQLNLIRNTLIY